MNREKPREIAARVLQRHAEGADYLEQLLEQEPAVGRLSPPDRGLLQELSFGVVRWQATLDWLVAQKTSNRPQKLPLQILLRLGLYQMFWLDRIPDHAAVHETVEMAKAWGFGQQSGFVNALLRGYLREREATEKKLEDLKMSEPSLGYSHPQWLCDRWQKRWGTEKLRQLLAWNNTPPKTFARLNTLRGDAETLRKGWADENVHASLRVGSDAVRWDWLGETLVFELKEHPPLATLPSFQQGLFYIQDPSTLLAVAELEPQPGESILDLCAAPGGKTTLIAQWMNNRGMIMAQDRHVLRREMVRQNCERLGVSIVQLSSPTTAVLPELSAPYDRILIDAPCSNTGVMRRRIDLRWRIRPEELKRLRTMQLELLAQGAVQLKQKGVLIYSTCSLEPEENREVVDEFLERHPGFALERERLVLPFVEEVDGAYVARLVYR